jgi:hypothetical protein
MTFKFNLCGGKIVGRGGEVLSFHCAVLEFFCKFGLASPRGGFPENECTKRNQGCPSGPANAVLAWHCTMPAGEHPSTGVASAEKLLGPSKKA